MQLIFYSKPGIRQGVNDLQTEADRRAQQCIIGNLSKQFPLLKIIGEEQNLSDQSAFTVVNDEDQEVLLMDFPDHISSMNEEDLVVWVDPLDGTSEYTQGMLDHVTVLIGVAYKNRAVGGVIHQPYHNFNTEKTCQGRTLWGIPGVGSGGFKPQPPPSTKIIATTRSHMTPLVQQTIDALKPDEVLKTGGAGYKVYI